MPVNNNLVVPGIGLQAPQEATSDVGTPQPQQPEPPGDVGGAVAGAAGAAAVLTAIQLGGKVTTREVLSLADDVGKITIPVTSNCVTEIVFHVASGDMEVTLKDGSVYFYPEENMATLVQWLNYHSKGVFYNKFMRGKHKYIMGKQKGWKMPLK